MRKFKKNPPRNTAESYRKIMDKEQCAIDKSLNSLNKSIKNAERLNKKTAEVNE